MRLDADRMIGQYEMPYILQLLQNHLRSKPFIISEPISSPIPKQLNTASDHPIDSTSEMIVWYPLAPAGWGRTISAICRCPVVSMARTTV